MTTLLIITALTMLAAVAFAGLVMWTIIHLQNWADRRDRLARRLQPRN